MTPSTALQELLDQHTRLRELMSACEALADEVDRGDGDPLQLTREVAKLRIAFTAHNEYEEALLRPVLLASDAFGAVRIEAMVAEHVDEHRTMRARLETPVTAELRDVLASLLAHLDAEEHYFLTKRVLRDDVVTLESSG